MIAINAVQEFSSNVGTKIARGCWETPTRKNMRMDTIETRLFAHRRILQWMLAKLAEDPVRRRELIAAFGNEFPPNDGQEDPGAVPTEAFAELCAIAREIDFLIGPFKSNVEFDETVKQT
jgi:hypothetical protein